MKFAKAFELMKQGEKVKLPSWGISGVQMGWLASQADMLADDWVFAD